MKNCFMKFLVVAVCAVFVIGVSCPVAFAASDDSSDVGFIVKTTEVSFNDLSISSSGSTFNGTVYLSVPYEIVASVDSVLLWFGDHAYTCKAVPSSKEGSSAVFVGNLSFRDSAESNTGEPFLVTFNTNHNSNCHFMLSTEFVEMLKTENDSSFSFSVQSIAESGVVGSVSLGFFGTLKWAGQVVTALISPGGAMSGILPVVGLAVGLAIVVWGIRKFKYCSWGF